MLNYHDWRFSARILAILLIAIEIVLNATSSSTSGAVVTMATVVVTVAGAFATPLASNAWHSGQKTAAIVLLAVFAPLVISLSFVSSLERVAGKTDSGAQKAASRSAAQRMATSTYDAAVAVRDASCGTDQTDKQRLASPNCLRANRAFIKNTSAATETISGASVEVGDAVAKRLASILSFAGVTEDQVTMYLPMLWPLALLVGGYVFAHIGWGHIDGEPAHEIAKDEPKIEALQEIPRARNLNQEETLAAIQAKIREASGELRIKSMRSLALEIGAATASLDVWMRRWKSTHLIVTKSGGEMTIRSVVARLAAAK